MKLEQTLNLVPVTKPKALNPILLRRQRLINNITAQIEKARLNQSGEKVRRVWWWPSDDGNIYINIKYGKIPLELAKGKSTIQCASMIEVAETLEKVKLLTSKGQLDELLSKASQDIRQGFGKA